MRTASGTQSARLQRTNQYGFCKCSNRTCKSRINKTPSGQSRVIKKMQLTLYSGSNIQQPLSDVDYSRLSGVFRTPDTTYRHTFKSA
ncbi:hypothetical protein AgCh_035127 [Apium graveolens]